MSFLLLFFGSRLELYGHFSMTKCQQLGLQELYIHNVEEWSFDCYTAIINNHNTTLHNHVHIGFHVGIAGAFLRPFWGIEIQKCMELGRRCQGTIAIAACNRMFPIWAVCHWRYRAIAPKLEPIGPEVSVTDTFFKDKPVEASHHLMEPSAAPEAMRCPSGV